MLHFVKPKLQSGVVLLSVLLLMQVMTLMGFAALQASNILHKESLQHWQAVNINMAETLLIKKISNDLMLQPLTFCESPLTCSGNFLFLQYYYLVEYLGEDPCAIITHPVPNDSINESAAFYRITIKIMINNRHTPLWIQGTIAKANAQKTECNGQPHWITQGLQMWHEF